MVKAGYSPSTANQRSDLVLKNPVIQQTMAQVLDKAGLSDDAIAVKLHELAQATKKTYFSRYGRVTDERTDPDRATQLAAVALTSKIKGIIIDKSMNLNINSEISPVDLGHYLTPSQESEVVDITI